MTDGKTVITTSGLLKYIQDKLDDIVELRYTDRKALVQDFTAGTFRLIHTEKPVLIPQIQYLTNDSWEIVSGIDGANGWPILHNADYSKGHLYVLTIPDNFADLYDLPAEVLNTPASVIDGLCIGQRVHEQLFKQAGPTPCMRMIEDRINGIPAWLSQDIQIVERLLVCNEMHASLCVNVISFCGVSIGWNRMPAQYRAVSIHTAA